MKWWQTAGEKQTAIFICIVYPGDSLYQTLLVLERFKIVLLPFSNPQFICMPGMCILLETHVCVLWLLKAIVKVHHKLSGHNPQSENFNGRMKSRWQDLFWWPSLLYSRRFFSVQMEIKGFHCGSQQKGEVPASLEHLYLKRGIWSDSQVTAQCVINVRAAYSSVSLRGSDTAMLWMQTDIISWVFGTVLSSLRMRPADNPRKYVIYFNSLYKSTSLAE